MRKVLKIIVTILAWVALLLAFAITMLIFSSNQNNGISTFMGYVPMKVESDSMNPTFAKGDLIICQTVDDVRSLKEEDVISFWTIINGRRVINTHRIVSVKDDGTNVSFMTRGDANDKDDDLPAYQSDIIAKWTGNNIKNGGAVMGFLQTQEGFFVCILIPMAIFFLFELYKFIFTIIDLKKGKENELNEEEIKKRAIEEYLAEQKKEEQVQQEQEVQKEQQVEQEK